MLHNSPGAVGWTCRQLDTTSLPASPREAGATGPANIISTAAEGQRDLGQPTHQWQHLPPLPPQQQQGLQPDSSAEQHGSMASSMADLGNGQADAAPVVAPVLLPRTSLSKAEQEQQCLSA
ncbi:hypothetical protein HaLaN_18352 [Haematococcus lacustris]|uniref:Uncharacterized protein n=1 Tax=Haematococcus lacustris TaxID=44745 RepID=A0A699ZYJ5_HAELA|nr:hypothetical protein HaLaN_18352 [Haematococcus lacustris]